MDNDGMKRIDQISMLEVSMIFTDTDKWERRFAYPGCGQDLVRSGLATEDGKITIAGRAALFLLGKGPDVTDTKSFQTFSL